MLSIQGFRLLLLLIYAHLDTRTDIIFGYGLCTLVSSHFEEILPSQTVIAAIRPACSINATFHLLLPEPPYFVTKHTLFFQVPASTMQSCSRPGLWSAKQ